jgi:hypothetical protein
MLRDGGVESVAVALPGKIYGCSDQSLIVASPATFVP